MTRLEQLIGQVVERSTVARIARKADDAAETLASEILADPTYRTEIQAIIRKHFTATLEALGQEPDPLTVRLEAIEQRLAALEQEP